MSFCPWKFLNFTNNENFFKTRSWRDMGPTAQDSLTFVLKIYAKVKGQGHSKNEKLRSFYISFVFQRILKVFATLICPLKTIWKISFLSPNINSYKSYCPLRNKCLLSLLLRNHKPQRFETFTNVCDYLRGPSDLFIAKGFVDPFYELLPLNVCDVYDYQDLFLNDKA